MIDKRRVYARTVRPRKPTSNANRPIYAIIDDNYCDESGVVGTTAVLLRRLKRVDPCIIATGNESARILELARDMWGNDPLFNFRVSPIEREIFTGKQNGRKLTLSLLAVSWFGWKRSDSHHGDGNRYHLLIDPLTFSGQWLPKRELAAYVKWAQNLREFCLTQNWDLRPTQGGTARQALRDPRFYPKPRRKIPRATNDRVRPLLPGNHYQLTVPPDDTEHEADYLDQSRCHHYHALNARLPDSNHTYGYGHFRNPDRGKIYKSDPKRIAEFLDGFMGVIYCTVFWRLSKRKEARFVPAYLSNYTSESHNKPVYVFSEDLPLLDALGVRITGIIAAWGGKVPDEGLRKYAEWAMCELSVSAPTWKKTLLLSPYGALATTPRKQTVAYYRSRKGAPRTLRSKAGIELTCSYHEASKVSEPSTNNVLHRALIESSNRSETLMYARFLEDTGRRVLAIYVDALMVETDEDFPGTPPLFTPWRLDKHLTRLRFLSESQFTSDQLRKLPGVSGQQARDALSRGTVGRAPRLGSKEQQQQRLCEAWIKGPNPAHKRRRVC